MSGLAVVPAWVVPPPGQVRDAHCIAHALAERAPELRPVAAAFDWVTAGGPSPLTERLDDPTAVVVRSEMMLGDAVAAGDAALPADVWAMLGVAPAAPVTTDRAWAKGVVGALAWLLGAQRTPPVPVPRRGPDGAPLTAEQLYAERIEGRHYLQPEDRARLRAEAEREAARFRVLAGLAASAVTG